ncbi:beta-lactamase family protein [bacterium]|nr:beta-lactamase family protein [bacterium]
MKHILWTILLLLVTTNLAAQDAQITTFSDTVNELMEDYHIPGAAIAIVRDSEVIFAEGFGVTNTQTGESVTADAVFPIGSISKSFTALAVMQLVDQGLLDLDEPISTYVPDLILAEEDAADQITLRMLLTHTAGFGNAALPTLDQYEDRDAVIADFERVPIAFEPGTIRSYSNYGYILMGYIIETVTGQSWEVYVQTNVFDPLSMMNSSFGSELLDAPSYAAPHTFDLIKGSIPMPFYEDIDLSGPAGSINATIGDMAEYVAFMTGDRSILLSPEMMTMLHTPSDTADDAFGWFDLELVGLDVFTNHSFMGHNGAFEGYNAFAAFDADTQTGAVVLTNMDVGTGENFTRFVLLEALALAVDEPLPTQVSEFLQEQAQSDAERFDQLMTTAQAYTGEPPQWIIGDYDSPYYSTFAIRETDDTFVVDIPEFGIEGLPLFFTDDNTFVLNLAGFVIYTIEAQGEDGVLILQDGRVIASKGFDKTLTTYTNDEVGFQVAIPFGLNGNTEEGITLYTVEDPPGTLGIAARAASDELLADVLDVLATATPGFTGDPIAVNSLPETNGRNWEQYVFAYEDQIYVVNTTRIDDVNVFLMAIATEANIEPTFLMMNDMTVSFTTTD